MVRVLFKDAKEKPSPRNAKKQKTDLHGQWAQSYSPNTAQKLALNEKKVKEISANIDPESSTRVLIVSGPAGSGKSTALRVLAQERGLRVIEYIPPESMINTTSMIESFREFLLGASVFNRNEVLILVEELPNIFHDETRYEFESALLDWIENPDLPLVAISFTEIEINAKYSEAIVVPRILGQLVQDKYCQQIKVNPPSSTLLKRLIKDVSSRQSVEIPATVVKELSMCGDIRNSLIALEMEACIDTKASLPTFKSPNVWVRDSPTELFYAIGKIVWTSKKENSLEKAIERFGDTMEFFNLTVLENYTSAKYQRLPIESAAKVAEWLSLVDLAPSMYKLGALGAAQEIAQADDDLSLPKQYIQTKLTQFPKWRRETAETQNKIKIKIKNQRLFANYSHTPTSVVLDELGYASQLKRPLGSLDLDDDDDSLLDDDDFDFDNFA